MIKGTIYEGIKHMPGRSEEEMYDITHKTTTVDKFFRWWAKTDNWKYSLLLDWIYVEGFQNNKNAIPRFLMMVKDEVINTISMIDSDVWMTEFNVAGKTVRVISLTPMFESIKHGRETYIEESKINQDMMKKLNEEDAAIDQTAAAGLTPDLAQRYNKDLLNFSKNYNKELQVLQSKYAEMKTAKLDYYLKLAAAAPKVTTQQPKQPQQQQQQKSQTGTVDTAGNPVNANGNPNPPNNESVNILRIKDVNEALPGGMDWEKHNNMSNWYQKPTVLPHLPSPRPKRMDSKRRQKIQDLEYEIDDLRNSKESIMSPHTAPSYEGSEGELENFWGEIGTEAAEILNSGTYTNSHEKLRELRKIGIENPEYVLDVYHEYFPEYNPKKERQRKVAEREAAKIQEKIDKIQARIDRWEEVYESINESLSTYNTDNADQGELQSLKDYMNAEGIDYTEKEDTIEFDDEQLDAEWQELISSMGLEPTKISAEVEYTDDEDDIKPLDVEDDDINIVDTEEDKVFYVKVSEDGQTFVGKIYKIFDDGDWRAKIVDGNSDTFEQLNYDPDFDDADIITFLRENYDSAEIIDQDEFEEHVEESVSTVMNKTEKMKNQVASMATGGILGGKKGDPGYAENISLADFTKDDEEDEEEPVKESKLHLPTLDEFMNE